MITLATLAIGVPSLSRSGGDRNHSDSLRISRDRTREAVGATVWFPTLLFDPDLQGTTVSNLSATRPTAGATRRTCRINIEVSPADEETDNFAG